MSVRNWCAVAGGFGAGLLAGVLVTSHVWIRTARNAGPSARTQYLLEHELLGNRATRAGDHFRGAVHYLNVADAEAGTGFRWLERARDTTYGEWFLDPWRHYVVLGEIERDMRAPELQEGMRGLEALYWGRAAVALERFGRPDLAEAPWAAATALDPKRSIEWHREFAALSGHGTEDLERAYLDSRSFEELAEALEEGRRRLERRAAAD